MYATLADLVDRFGQSEIQQLTDRTRSGTPDAEVVGQALADAVAEIDSYVLGRYPQALDPVPPILTRIACDIARYQLYAKRPNGASDDVRNRYLDVRRMLESIQRGDVQLGMPDGEVAQQAGGGNYRVRSRVKRFGGRLLDEYQ